MRLEGGCYCGAVRYVAEGEPVLRAQCDCRGCQHVSGRAPNLFMLIPAEEFAWTKGAPSVLLNEQLDEFLERVCDDLEVPSSAPVHGRQYGGVITVHAGQVEHVGIARVGSNDD